MKVKYAFVLHTNSSINITLQHFDVSSIFVVCFRCGYMVSSFGFENWRKFLLVSGVFTAENQHLKHNFSPSSKSFCFSFHIQTHTWNSLLQNQYLLLWWQFSHRISSTICYICESKDERSRGKKPESTFVHRCFLASHQFLYALTRG